ncbi:MAG: alpha/beta fold hydrolase [Ignavibacteriaceae bacterium]
MKIRLFIIAILVTLISGCSGYLYTDGLGIEFEDIDYSFPTKTVLKNPSIAYIDQGSGENTIILVHGLASNAGFWRYAIPELAKNNRVIAVDLPGYGKSQKNAYPYSISFYAEQIKRFIDELKLKNVVLVGHSMGGQISIMFDLKYPGVLKKLVLASPAGIEEFERGEGDWLRSVMTKNGVKNTTEEGIRRNLAMNFYSWSDDLEWMVEERVRMAKGKDFDEFAYTVVRCVNAMLDEPTWNKIENIKTPTLIVYGKYDGLIPNMYLNPGSTSDVFKYAVGRIQNLQLHAIDNCGHMLQIEKPNEFTGTVLEFVR